jgi:hypothetical protein
MLLAKITRELGWNSSQTRGLTPGGYTDQARVTPGPRSALSCVEQAREYWVPTTYHHQTIAGVEPPSANITTCGSGVAR